MASEPRFSALRWALALVALGCPVVAHGAKEVLTIDPLRSEVALQPDASISFGFAGGIDGGSGALSAIGSGGATLPSGTASDGRRTSLSGSIFVDIVPGASIGFASRATSIRAGPSGSFLPGLPAAPATPSPANLAVAFAGSTIGISGSAALRAMRFSISLPSDGAPVALTPAGAGRWTFAGPVTVVLLNGSIDATSSVSAGPTHAELARTSVVSASGGGVRDLPGGAHELTLNLDAQATTLGSPRTGPIPLATLGLHVAGQIVAAPEPDASAAAITALSLLASRAWRRRRPR